MIRALPLTLALALVGATAPSLAHACQNVTLEKGKTKGLYVEAGEEITLRGETAAEIDKRLKDRILLKGVELGSTVVMLTKGCYEVRVVDDPR